MNRRHFIEKMILAGGIPISFGCNKDDVRPSWNCDGLPPEVSINPKLIINNDLHDAHNSANQPINEEDFLNIRLSKQVPYANYIFYSTGTTHVFTHRTSVGSRKINSFIEYLETQNTDPLAVAAKYVQRQGKKRFF